MPIPLTVQYKAQVCSRSISGIARANPLEGMNFHFLFSLRVL
jgi:hypothetical protein